MPDPQRTGRAGVQHAAGAPLATTVIIPARNEERLVGRAIASVIGQLAPDDALFLIDDGSTDGTLQIMQACASADRRIRVFSNPASKGPAKSINDVLETVQTPSFARQDADDISLPGRIAFQKAILAAQRRRGVAGCAYYQINYGTGEDYLVIPSSDERRIDQALKSRNVVNIGSAMFDTRAAREVGAFDEEFAATEGYRLVRRLRRDGCEIANSAIPGYVYFIGASENRSAAGGSFSARNRSMAASLDARQVFYKLAWRSYSLLPRPVQIALRTAASERSFVRLPAAARGQIGLIAAGYQRAGQSLAGSRAEAGQAR